MLYIFRMMSKSVVDMVQMEGRAYLKLLYWNKIS